MSAAWLAAADPVSAPVTQWPMRVLLVLVVVAVIGLVLVGMRRGWQRRGRRQSDIAAPPTPPGALAAVDAGPVPGVYLGSTSHGDWLDRIVVHELGVRSRADAESGPDGVLIRRQGAADVYVPAGLIREVGSARGIAGKAYERGGVLVVTWELGGRLVDTGFRADAADEQRHLLDAIAGLVTDQGVAGEGTR